MRARYAALFGFCVALATVHAIVGFYTPIQGDDWNHWVWAGQHAGDDNWWLSWARTHFTFADALGYLLSRCRSFHVLVSPMVVLALVTGLYTVAMRRLPRATWQDLLGIALTSALIWLTQPAAGVMLFYTPHLALYVYGAAIAAWLLAPFRCGWTVPRAAWPLLALAGYCAGSSSRAIGIAMLVGVIYAIRRVPRERRATWMWIALGGLVAGVIAGYLMPPWIEFGRVFRRGLEANLTGQGLIRYALQETGETITLVATFVLADLVLGVIGRQRATADGRPSDGETLAWVLGSFVVAIWCQFGPRYNEAALFPVTCMLVIAAVQYLMWLATSRILHMLIVGVVVGVHAIVWPMSLVKYHQYGHEGFARMAALERTKPGAVAYVDRYSQITPTFWFFGEDLGFARQRQLVAVEGFGVSDISLLPVFRRLELNPHIEIELEVEGITEAQLQAARVPRIWASELSAARKQFELFAKRLRAVAKDPVARLVVKNVEFPERGTRPLLAAWLEGKTTMNPRILRSSLDEHSQYTMRIYGKDAREFKEAWVIDNGVTNRARYERASVRLQPLSMELQVVMLCNTARCLVADAFVPRF
jgi:hypothetical protein